MMALLRRLWSRYRWSCLQWEQETSYLTSKSHKWEASPLTSKRTSLFLVINAIGLVLGVLVLSVLMFVFPFILLILAFFIVQQTGLFFLG